MLSNSRARIVLIVFAACAVAFAASCKRRDDKPATIPAPPSPTANVAAPSRTTPTDAAIMLRWLAERSESQSDLLAGIDPSQANTAGVFVAPTLIYYARLAELQRTAAARFGPQEDGAIDESSLFFVLDLGNGVRELFDAHRFEEVRRVGSVAYVMAMIDDQPVGAPIVFRNNQGDWLLMLMDGDTPWPDARIALLQSLLSGPVEGLVDYAMRIEGVTKRLRAGEIKTLEQLRAEVDALID